MDFYGNLSGHLPVHQMMHRQWHRDFLLTFKKKPQE